MNAFFVVVVYFTMLIDIVFLITFINLLLRAVFCKENYIKLIKDECSDIFSIIFGRSLLIIVPLIIFSNIYCLIVDSGANAQIGSFFEAKNFTAKYEVNVELRHSGKLSTRHSIITHDIDGKTVEATIYKVSKDSNTIYGEDYWGNEYQYMASETGYFIASIEYKGFTLINNEEGELAQVGKSVSFCPETILRNGAILDIDGDYPEYNVVLSDTLLEKLENLAQKDNSINSLYLVSYIIFLCLSIAYLLWVVNKQLKSKKALLLTAIISICISVCLVALPISFYINC